MKWSKGIAEWIEGEDAFISVVFSWDMEAAWTRARWLHSSGYRVRVGGPGTHVKTPARVAMSEFAQMGGHAEDAVVRHNPSATFASRGCPVGCWFCIVPSMEGRTFTMIDDFPVRPILCDNNLSGLPADFQDHIVRRYQDAGMMVMDAQSGFEPRTFDEDVFHRWKSILRGPWRFAYDDQGDGPHVERVMKMLRVVQSPKRKRIYVLLGNEPVAECMDRLMKVIAWGGEPHCQPIIKLNAEQKEPWIRFDWTRDKLVQVARWANRRLWKYCTFDEYDGSVRTSRIRKPDNGIADLWSQP